MYLITNRVSSTKYAVTEHTEIWEDGYLVAHGRYKWLNRPWQRFTYESSISNALHKLYPLKRDRAKLDPLMAILRDARDNESATRTIEDILNQEAQ